MAGHWMEKAFGNSHGQFRAKAKKAGMSTEAFASKEAHNPNASTKTKRQANLAKLGEKYGGGHHHSETHSVTAKSRAPSEDPTVSSSVEMGYAKHKKAVEPHSFRPVTTSQAHGYKHTHKQGALRMSGHPGAHRIGGK